MDFLTGFLIGLSVVLSLGTIRLYGIASELRRKNRNLKTELSRTSLRFKRWKHYAHILEIRATAHGVKGAARDAIRSQYIHDFDGWGETYGQASELQPTTRDRV